MDTRYEVTYFPTTAVTANYTPRRNHSCLEVRDSKTNEVKKFTITKKLGEGSYGYVRLAICGDEKLAIKAPKDNEDIHHLTAAGIAHEREKIEKEFTLMRECYPNERYYFFKDYITTEEDKRGDRYSFRMGTPYIPGKKLATYVKRKITNVDDMAKLTLRVWQELQRIHDEQKIHGDAGERNVHIKSIKKDGVIVDFKVHFMDFGLGYKRSGDANVGFTKDKPCETSDMAPERQTNRKLKAHPAQDVYSIAYAINESLDEMKNPEFKKSFFENYPVVKNFISNGLLKDWKRRPNLADSISHLESDLNWKANAAPVPSFFTYIDELEKQFKQLNKNHLYAQKNLSNIARVLEAAKFLAKNILDDTQVDVDNFDNYIDTITATPELFKHYENLVKHKCIKPADDNGFGDFSMLTNQLC